jgi:hypothetical protein
MSSVSDFAYAQARLQACYGRRPDESTWRQLASVRELAPFLERAHDTALRPWVAGIGASSSVHEIETGLRNLMRVTIRETAGWVPLPWRPMVLWTAQLPDLPVLAHLVRGEQALEWMTGDPRLKPYLVGAAEVHHERLLRRPAASPRERDDALGMLGSWFEQWRSLWPPVPERDRKLLEKLVAMVRSHLAAFARLAPTNAWEARRAMVRRLRFMFRRCAFTAAAVIVYLLLAALDLERLRAEVVERLIYAGGQAAS